MFSPRKQRKTSQRAKIFSPRKAGGDVAERQRGAARAQEGGTPVGTASAPPLCLTASPPQGGEKNQTNRPPLAQVRKRNARKFSPPLQRKTSQREQNFLPPLAGGDVAERQRGVPRAHNSGHTPPRCCERTPPLPTGISPQGGEKNQTLRHLPAQVRKRNARKFSPPLQRKTSQREQNFLPPLAGGDVAERQRGVPRAHNSSHTPPRRCARTPLCLSASPPQGGEKNQTNRHLPAQVRKRNAQKISPRLQRKTSQRSEIFSPRLRGEMSQRDRGGPPTDRPPHNPFS